MVGSLRIRRSVTSVKVDIGHGMTCDKNEMKISRNELYIGVRTAGLIDSVKVKHLKLTTDLEK